MNKTTNNKPQVKAVHSREMKNNDKKLTLNDKITIKELEEQLVKMAEDKEKKCASAKEQLISMLEVTVDKYRTATGTAEALRVLRFTVGDTNDSIDLSWPNSLAIAMADVANSMKLKAEKLSYDEMDQLCDGFYDKEFKITSGETDEEHTLNYMKLAEEMMRIDLCRNVGGAAEDMVEFIARVDAEIEATQKKLDELKA